MTVLIVIECLGLTAGTVFLIIGIIAQRRGNRYRKEIEEYRKELEELKWR